MKKTKAQLRDEQFDNVKKSLISALEMKGEPAAFMLDRIDEYMTFWLIRYQLVDAIGKTKAFVKYDNGGGQSGKTINPAVKELPKISKQMANILEDLQLSGVVIDDDSGL